MPVPRFWERVSRGEGHGGLAPMSLQPVDEVRWVARPPRFRFYGEDQYTAYADEQVKLHEAKGIALARQYARVAAKTAPTAGVVRQRIADQQERVRDAAEHVRAITAALAPFARRGRFEKARYLVVTVLLLLGDIAGVAGAAIMLGEEPWLAVLQALASGTAAVTAGLVGAEVKDSRRARTCTRDPTGLPDELRPYAHLFTGGDAGETLVKMLAGGTIVIVLALASAILALRSSTEGTLAGIVFAGLAVAVSLASFLNVYTYTDEVADLIDSAGARLRRTEHLLHRLSRNRSLRRHEDAVAAVASIEREQDARRSSRPQRERAEEPRAQPAPRSRRTRVHGRAIGQAHAERERHRSEQHRDRGSREEAPVSQRLLRGTLLDPHLLGHAHVTAATVSGSGRVGLGPLGRCPHHPVCTWFVVDSSGSVSGTHGNDPTARRFDEARLAVHAVARRCRCGRERIGIVHFDTPTSLDLHPTRIDQHGLRGIERCLAIPRDAAGQSLLRTSLDTVITLASGMPDHLHVLVALTDFQLFDDDLPGLYRDLSRFPGAVHAVSLRSAPPAELEHDANVVVTHITPDAQRGSVARAILAGLTEHRLA
jgi:hypothetical protein